MAMARYGDERDFLRRLTAEERNYTPTAPPPAPAGVPASGPAAKVAITPAAAPAAAAPASYPRFTYDPPTYRGPTTAAIPTLPQFDAPEFVAPDYAALQNDPSYRFRVAEGERALQGSAAARGTLRTGGTLRDLVNYGQAAAAQEAQNAYDRAVTTYGLNYSRARDRFAPRLLDYSTRSGANQDAARAAWQRYTFGRDDEFRREAMVAGMQAPGY